VLWEWLPMSARFGPELLRGSLDLMVLSLLANGSTYGYDLQQKLLAASGQLIQLPPGTMYPLLHRLEAERLIRSRWEATTGRKRKWYEITALGRKRLVAQTHEWDRYVACIQSILAPLRQQGLVST
jgi:PadR family transcriptional regulator, regulatory protein PadR